MKKKSLTNTHNLRTIQVSVSARATKQMKNLPQHIAVKFAYWVDLIQFIGLREARKYKGFHDEPLKGKREGERSVRLSKSYRAIYVELSNEVLKVIEVNKHDY